MIARTPYLALWRELAADKPMVILAGPRQAGQTTHVQAIAADYAVIENRASRFENMVALELLRAVTAWNDAGLGAFGLHFVRNKEKEEADFLITERRRPRLLVEAKVGDRSPARPLLRFQRQLKVPAVQLVDEGDTYRSMVNDGHPVLVAPAWLWLPRLP